MINTNDYIGAQNDVDSILKLALKTHKGVNMLLKACESETVKKLMQSNAEKTGEFYDRTKLIVDKFERLRLIDEKKKKTLEVEFNKNQEELNILSKECKITKEASLQARMESLHTNMVGINKKVENIDVFNCAIHAAYEQALNGKLTIFGVNMEPFSTINNINPVST